MTAGAYPATLAAHGPMRSLETLLAQLRDRHRRLTTALHRGTRIANAQTRDELRQLHSQIRDLEAEIDARAAR